MRYLILELQDAEKILKYYRGNIGVALRHLFPEIGVELSKVPKTRMSIFFIFFFYDQFIYYILKWITGSTTKTSENSSKNSSKNSRKGETSISLVAANWYNILTRDIEDANVLLITFSLSSHLLFPFSPFPVI